MSEREELIELFMQELDGVEVIYSKWDYWALAIEHALLGVAAGDVKRWVFKGPDGKWWVR